MKYCSFLLKTCIPSSIKLTHDNTTKNTVATERNLPFVKSVHEKS